jgi:hypothetical protein
MIGRTFSFLMLSKLGRSPNFATVVKRILLTFLAVEDRAIGFFRTVYVDAALVKMVNLEKVGKPNGSKRPAQW